MCDALEYRIEMNPVTDLHLNTYKGATNFTADWTYSCIMEAEVFCLRHLKGLKVVYVDFIQTETSRLKKEMSQILTDTLACFVCQYLNTNSKNHQTLCQLL